jgi:uncharacterized protein YdaU (DUF1376 family)
MPLYVNDYEGDTAHLTIEEDGMYSRLLRLCWRTSGCSVPHDKEWLIKKLRINEVQYTETLEPLINDYFKIKKGRVLQGRQQKEFKRIIKKLLSKKRNGKKGGDAKALKSKKKISSKGTNSPLAKSYQPDLDLEPDLDLGSKKKIYTKEFELFFVEFPNKLDKHAASKNFTKEKTFTTAKHLTECAKVYSNHVAESKTDCIYKAKNFIAQKYYENYEPEDKNKQTWEAKLNAYEKGKWLPDWGSKPSVNGWKQAEHGEVPKDLEERFMQIHRGTSEGNIGRC